MRTKLFCAIWIAMLFIGILSAQAPYSASTLEKLNRISNELEFIENRYRFAGLRSSVHTDRYRFARWDLYAGANAFFTFSEISTTPLVKSSEQNPATAIQHRNSFSATGFLGARFAATRHVGAWAELGFGVSILNAGVSYRFAKKEPAGRGKGR